VTVPDLAGAFVVARAMQRHLLLGAVALGLTDQLLGPRAVAGLDGNLALYGLSGGELLRAGRAQGLAVKGEVFADRTYRHDGSLTPRDQPGALIDSEEQAIEQVLGMVREGRVRAVGGGKISVTADTLCLHGDGPHAVTFAKGVRESLKRAGVDVRACV